MKYDILIAGVGGQGTVLASKLLAACAIEAGYFTRTSETIGMAQRGGCVVSHVRMESKNTSPIIPLGCADLLIGFEPAEAARNLSRLSPDAKCVISTRPVMPVTASLGNAAYDVEAIYDYIRSRVPGSLFVDGYSLAEKAGSVKAINVVLLGVAAAAGALPFEKEAVERVIAANIPAKHVDLNIRAFNIGFNTDRKL